MPRPYTPSKTMTAALSLLPAPLFGESQLVCQDNLDYMRSLPAESMQLVVTSPPYNIGKIYGNRRQSDRQAYEAYIEGQRQVIAEAARLLTPMGSICWQVGNHIQKDGEVIPLDIALHPIFKELGFKLRNRIIWTFGHGLHNTKRLSGRHETILWFTRDDYIFNLDPIRIPSKYPHKKYFRGPKKGQLSGNPLGKNPGDVWDIPNVKSNHVEKTTHPCQFPVELIERLVLSLTNPGDYVLDPYVGVGTSVVAAERHGRIGFGCDVVPEYIDIAYARLEALRAGTLRTRPMDRPIYDPGKPGGGQ